MAGYPPVSGHGPATNSDHSGASQFLPGFGNVANQHFATGRQSSANGYGINGHVSDGQLAFGYPTVSNVHPEQNAYMAMPPGYFRRHAEQSAYMAMPPGHFRSSNGMRGRNDLPRPIRSEPTHTMPASFMAVSSPFGYQQMIVQRQMASSRDIHGRMFGQPNGVGQPVTASVMMASAAPSVHYPPGLHPFDHVPTQIHATVGPTGSGTPLGLPGLYDPLYGQSGHTRPSSSNSTISFADLENGGAIFQNGLAEWPPLIPHEFAPPADVPNVADLGRRCRKLKRLKITHPDGRDVTEEILHVNIPRSAPRAPEGVQLEFQSKVAEVINGIQKNGGTPSRPSSTDASSHAVQSTASPSPAPPSSTQ